MLTQSASEGNSLPGPRLRFRADAPVPKKQRNNSVLQSPRFENQVDVDTMKENEGHHLHRPKLTPPCGELCKEVFHAKPPNLAVRVPRRAAMASRLSSFSRRLPLSVFLSDSYRRVNAARKASRRTQCENNLKQIVAAM